MMTDSLQAHTSLESRTPPQAHTSLDKTLNLSPVFIMLWLTRSVQICLHLRRGTMTSKFGEPTDQLAEPAGGGA